MAVWPINSKGAIESEFHDQIKKIIKYFKRMEYSMDIKQQLHAWYLVTVHRYGYDSGSGLRLIDDID